MIKTIRFNAGKVQYDDETKKCTPLPHKGVVTVAPSEEDEGFFDFLWTPKSGSGLEKDELLLIPGDMTFKRVASCKTGRVVALTFLSSGDKSLYWLQDVGDVEELDQWTAKDLELVSSVQALITPAEEEEEEQEQEQEQEEEAAADETKNVPVKQESVTKPEDNYPVLLLSDVLTEELVRKHLESLLSEEITARYGDMLPESVEPTVDQILEVVRGEFFRSANAEFGSNITENNIGLILANSFGYDYTGEGLDAFLKGLRDSEKKKRK